MTSDRFKSEAGTTGSPSLILEVASQDKTTPRPFPVLIQNLSMGGVTLAVAAPWGIADWDHYRGRECVLRVEDSKGKEVVSVNAKISWTKFGGPGQPALSLGAQMVHPSEEMIRQLSDLLAHTPRDIRGLWDRYDQVRDIPGPSHLVRCCYFAGLGLLLGGLALQFSGSSTYKMYGWALWLFGTLGIAGKIIWPLWQKRAAVDHIGKTF
jgi:hypothetical protein